MLFSSSRNFHGSPLPTKEIPNFTWHQKSFTVCTTLCSSLNPHSLTFQVHTSSYWQKAS